MVAFPGDKERSLCGGMKKREFRPVLNCKQCLSKSFDRFELLRSRFRRLQVVKKRRLSNDLRSAQRRLSGACSLV